jgi:hypothetical protein
VTYELSDDLAIKSDFQHFYFKEDVFTPFVLDYEQWDGNVDAVNVLKVKLDLTLSSDLNFDSQIEQAKKAEEKGLFLWWELDLGLFGGLTEGLEQESQFLSLEIACKHFNDQVLAPFASSTFAISLFKGAIEDYEDLRFSDDLQKQWQNWLKDRFETLELINSRFSKPFTSFEQLSLEALSHSEEGRFERKLFFQDIALNYMHMLLLSFSSSTLIFILQDLKNQNTLAEKLAFSLPDTFEFFEIATKGDKGLESVLKTIVWEGSPESENEQLFDTQTMELKNGILIPDRENFYFSHIEKLNSVFESLKSEGLSFRAISDKFLIEQWEGLNKLWVLKTSLNRKLERKIKGFEAAGGEVVYV